MDVGDIILCKKDFTMINGKHEGQKTFSLFKTYEVLGVDEITLVVENDFSEAHYFEFDGPFFKEHFDVLEQEPLGKTTKKKMAI
jgi:hypothetical protein